MLFHVENKIEKRSTIREILEDHLEKDVKGNGGKNIVLSPKELRRVIIEAILEFAYHVNLIKDYPGSHLSNLTASQKSDTESPSSAHDNREKYDIGKTIENDIKAELKEKAKSEANKILKDKSDKVNEKDFNRKFEKKFIENSKKSDAIKSLKGKLDVAPERENNKEYDAKKSDMAKSLKDKSDFAKENRSDKKTEIRKDGNSNSTKNFSTASNKTKNVLASIFENKQDKLNLSNIECSNRTTICEDEILPIPDSVPPIMSNIFHMFLKYQPVLPENLRQEMITTFENNGMIKPSAYREESPIHKSKINNGTDEKNKTKDALTREESLTSHEISAVNTSNYTTKQDSSDLVIQDMNNKGFTLDDNDDPNPPKMEELTAYFATLKSKLASLLTMQHHSAEVFNENINVKRSFIPDYDSPTENQDTSFLNDFDNSNTTSGNSSNVEPEQFTMKQNKSEIKSDNLMNASSSYSSTKANLMNLTDAKSSYVKEETLLSTTDSSTMNTTKSSFSNDTTETKNPLSVEKIKKMSSYFTTLTDDLLSSINRNEANGQKTNPFELMSTEAMNVQRDNTLSPENKIPFTILKTSDDYADLKPEPYKEENSVQKSDIEDRRKERSPSVEEKQSFKNESFHSSSKVNNTSSCKKSGACINNVENAPETGFTFPREPPAADLFNSLDAFLSLLERGKASPIHTNPNQKDSTPALVNTVQEGNKNGPYREETFSKNATTNATMKSKIMFHVLGDGRSIVPRLSDPVPYSPSTTYDIGDHPVYYIDKTENKVRVNNSVTQEYQHAMNTAAVYSIPQSVLDLSEKDSKASESFLEKVLTSDSNEVKEKNNVYETSNIQNNTKILNNTLNKTSNTTCKKSDGCIPFMQQVLNNALNDTTLQSHYDSSPKLLTPSVYFSNTQNEKSSPKNKSVDYEEVNIVPDTLTIQTHAPADELKGNKSIVDSSPSKLDVSIVPDTVQGQAQTPLILNVVPDMSHEMIAPKPTPNLVQLKPTGGNNHLKNVHKKKDQEPDGVPYLTPCFPNCHSEKLEFPLPTSEPVVTLPSLSGHGYTADKTPNITSVVYLLKSGGYYPLPTLSPMNLYPPTSLKKVKENPNDELSDKPYVSMATSSPFEVLDDVVESHLSKDNSTLKEDSKLDQGLVHKLATSKVPTPKPHLILTQKGKSSPLKTNPLQPTNLPALTSNNGLKIVSLPCTGPNCENHRKSNPQVNLLTPNSKVIQQASSSCRNGNGAICAADVAHAMKNSSTPKASFPAKMNNSLVTNAADNDAANRTKKPKYYCEGQPCFTLTDIMTMWKSLNCSGPLCNKKESSTYNLKNTLNKPVVGPIKQPASSRKKIEQVQKPKSADNNRYIMMKKPPMGSLSIKRGKGPCPCPDGTPRFNCNIRCADLRKHQVKQYASKPIQKSARNMGGVYTKASPVKSLYNSYQSPHTKNYIDKLPNAQQYNTGQKFTAQTYSYLPNNRCRTVPYFPYLYICPPTDGSLVQDDLHMFPTKRQQVFYHNKRQTLKRSSKKSPKRGIHRGFSSKAAKDRLLNFYAATLLNEIQSKTNANKSKDLKGTYKSNVTLSKDFTSYVKNLVSLGKEEKAALAEKMVRLTMLPAGEKRNYNLVGRESDKFIIPDNHISKKNVKRLKTTEWKKTKESSEVEKRAREVDSLQFDTVTKSDGSVSKKDSHIKEYGIKHHTSHRKKSNKVRHGRRSTLAAPNFASYLL